LEENAMFTYEDFKYLISITDRNELIHAISQIPEEDLRSAFVLVLLAWEKNQEINQELWNRKFNSSDKA